MDLMGRIKIRVSFFSISVSFSRKVEFFVIATEANNLQMNVYICFLSIQLSGKSMKIRFKEDWNKLWTSVT